METFVQGVGSTLTDTIGLSVTHTHEKKKKSEETWLQKLEQMRAISWYQWWKVHDIPRGTQTPASIFLRLDSTSGSLKKHWAHTEGVQKWPNTPRRLFIVLISHIGFDKAALHFYILILETYQSKLFTAVRGETVVKTERLSGNPPQHGPECNKQPSESIHQVATPQINKGRGFFCVF